MFPLINRLSHFNQNLVPSTPVSRIQQSVFAQDRVAVFIYAVIFIVCCPIWEETIFHGFLLPSLTKYMPVWCSILVTSVNLSLAHFHEERILPLIFFGIVSGAVFARSGNLLASILLHSIWNAFVFLDLMKQCSCSATNSLIRYQSPQSFP